MRGSCFRRARKGSGGERAALLLSPPLRERESECVPLAFCQSALSRFSAPPLGAALHELSEMLHHVKWNSWSDMQCAARAAGHSFVSFLYQNVCALRVRFKGRGAHLTKLLSRGDLNMYGALCGVGFQKRNLSNKCCCWFCVSTRSLWLGCCCFDFGFFCRGRRLYQIDSIKNWWWSN